METTGARESTGWQRLKFQVIGWLYCLFTGNSNKYNVLLAQANLESRDGKSALMMNAYNAWGMHAPTPYAVGELETSDGRLAVFPGNWTSWKARLQWDERHRVPPMTSVTEYMQAVQGAGYNASPAYVAAWMAQYQRLPAFARLMDAPEDNSTWWGRMRSFMLSWLIFGLALTLLMYVGKRLMKRR